MKTLTYNGENEAINNFIIDTMLIDPITKIIEKLKRNEFRGYDKSDIDYLDKKLEYFASIACELLNIEFSHIIAELRRKDSSLLFINASIKERYIGNFTVLLEFFKSIRLSYSD